MPHSRAGGDPELWKRSPTAIIGVDNASPTRILSNATCDTSVSHAPPGPASAPTRSAPSAPVREPKNTYQQATITRPKGGQKLSVHLYKICYSSSRLILGDHRPRPLFDNLPIHVRGTLSRSPPAQRQGTAVVSRAFLECGAQNSPAPARGDLA